MRVRLLYLFFVFFLFLSACTLLSDLLDDEQTSEYENGEREALPSINLDEQFSEPITCTPVNPPSVTDLYVYQTPDLPEPDPRTAFLDSVFGTCVIRATDRTTDISADDPSAGLKNEYSRVQSFNADDSLLLVRAIEGTWYVYHAATLLSLAQLPLAVEPRWDVQNPNLIYYFDETALFSYDLQLGERTIVHDFSQDFPHLSLAAVWTRYEGSPSRDSRYWGLMAQDTEWNVVAFLVYDLHSDQVIAKRELPTSYEIDTVTISPMGTYFLAYFDNYCVEGELGRDDHPCGLMVYDRDLQNGRGLLRIIGHSDLALDAQGREVLVYQSIDTDTISFVDLTSGAVTDLFPIDFSHTAIGLHFSGQAFDLPGWVLVSTYGDDARSYTWMDNQVFALELKAGGRVARLAHTHSLVDSEQEHDYWAEPQASVNRDFTRVVFTSNWGRSGTEEVEMYLIELLENWEALIH